MSRRVYTREFKVSAVKLVQERYYTVSEAAKSLGVDASSIRFWVKKFGPEVGISVGGSVGGDAALRAENRWTPICRSRIFLGTGTSRTAP